MTRFLAVLMAFLFIFIAGCNNSFETSSDDSSFSGTDQSSLAAESDASSEPEPYIPPVNVAKGKKYSVLYIDGEFRNDGFGDGDNGSNQRLTDGATTDESSMQGIAGYSASELVVVIDLGKQTQNIKTFNIDLFYGEWDIYDPVSVEYFFSDDGSKYTSAGTVDLHNAVPKPVLGSNHTWLASDFTKILEKTISARYIKVRIIAGNHIWSSELSVTTGNNGAVQIPPSEELITNGVSVVNITTRKHIVKDYYVDARIEVLDATGVFPTIIDENATIKVRGNSTSGGPKKPYNFKFSDDQNVLGIGKAKKFCLLANLYDKTLMRNKLSYDLADDIGLDYTSHSEYVDVYLNGKYLGNYMLCEIVGTGDSRVDIDINNNDFLFEYEPWPQYSNPSCFETPVFGILLGFNDRDDATPSQYEYVNNFFTQAENAILTKSAEQIGKYIDIKSFVDFYIINELFKNVDFSTSSTRFYIQDNMLYGGPMWDLDLSSGNVSTEYYTKYFTKNDNEGIEGFYCKRLFYSYLFECPEFESLVYERYVELQPYITNLFESNSLGVNRIDNLLDIYGASFNSNYDVAGWSLVTKYCAFETLTPLPTYIENVEYLRSWLSRRNIWLLENLAP